MKKTLCKILIIVILINFIINSLCYAAGETGGQQDGGADLPDSPFIYHEDDENTLATPSNTIASDLLEDGVTSQTNNGGKRVSTNSTMAGTSMIGVIMGYLALIIDIIPLQLHVILSSMSVTSVQNADGSANTDFWITIERIVFNQVALFNINYFDDANEYKVGNGAGKEVTITKSEANTKIRESITKMFMICRVLAMVIALLVLIYIGIRMAISTVASEQARYKQMLMAWVESLVIMFLLVYIIVIMINFGESLTNVFYNIKTDLLASGEESFEVSIVDNIFEGIQNSSGLRLAMYSIMYWVLVYTQFKFFYLYMKRLLMVGFLIMISPLITITYSIDKVGDNKAQAFGIWFKEFSMNVLIQPLHAIIYLVFMFTAGEIAKYAPILGLIFMLSLGTVESMVKTIFNAGGLKSLKGLNKFRKKG